MKKIWLNENNFIEIKENKKENDDNLDIDYDKLAEAMVKANNIIKKAEKEKIENEYKKNRDEWNKILGIVEMPDKKYFFPIVNRIPYNH